MFSSDPESDKRYVDLLNCFVLSSKYFSWAFSKHRRSLFRITYRFHRFIIDGKFHESPDSNRKFDRLTLAGKRRALLEVAKNGHYQNQMEIFIDKKRFQAVTSKQSDKDFYENVFVKS
jgi:hypothetical protein